MYRNLIILTVFILSLSACGSNEAPQSQHDASLSKALTTIAAVESETVTTMPNCGDCPVTNGECDSTPEKCTEMGIQCPQTMTQSSDCPSAITADCPSMTEQGCAKIEAIAEQGCPNVEPTRSDVTTPTVDTPTTSILTLQLENDFGAVFVPHSQHVEMYSCEVCHPTAVPGKIEKTKKEFHALCRKCHAEEKSGPTKCRGCHQR